MILLILLFNLNGSSLLLYAIRNFVKLLNFNEDFDFQTYKEL